MLWVLDFVLERVWWVLKLISVCIFCFICVFEIVFVILCKVCWFLYWGVVVWVVEINNSDELNKVFVVVIIFCLNIVLFF